MSIQISEVFSGLAAQQITALIGVLKKGQQHAVDNGVSEADMLQTRLIDDMHPLVWQVQATLDLVSRGAARLSDAELPDNKVDGDNFAAVIAQVESVLEKVTSADSAALDASADKNYQIPAGPDVTIPLTGRDYALKFLLPNLYFHLTMVYALLRQQGVELGKRDFLGPF